MPSMKTYWADFLGSKIKFMKQKLFSIGLILSFALISLAQITCPLTTFASQNPTPPSIAQSENASNPQPIAVKGTKINLIKPEGFTESNNFPGFQQSTTGTTIVVTEFPGAYTDVASGFTPENLKPRGMSLISKEKVSVDSYQGFLIKFTQNANGQEYGKLGVIFGDDKESVFIVASFPIELEKDLSSLLKDSLIKAKWDRKKEVDPFADLSFSVDGSGPLKFAKRLQSTLLYSQDGKFPVEVETPIFVVGKSVSDFPEGNTDYKAFAENRLNQSVENRNIMVVSGEAVTIDNINGYEIIANGNDSATNSPVAIYQVLLFDDKNYFIMQGLVGAKSKDQFLVEFKKIARSFKKKTN